MTVIESVFFSVLKVMRKTYYDDGAGDGDRCQHGVGDCVGSERVHDALIVAVNAPVVWLGHNGHDDEGQCR